MICVPSHYQQRSFQWITTDPFPQHLNGIGRAWEHAFHSGRSNSRQVTCSQPHHIYPFSIGKKIGPGIFPWIPGRNHQENSPGNSPSENLLCHPDMPLMNRMKTAGEQCNRIGFSKHFRHGVKNFLGFRTLRVRSPQPSGIMKIIRMSAYLRRNRSATSRCVINPRYIYTL